MKRVAVFCGSNYGVQPEYEQAAQQLGAFLAEKGLAVVYGGGNVGLMGALARAALEAGGDVIGVMPALLEEYKDDQMGLTELHMVATLHDRKAKMADLADGFIALPGGLGTMEEIFEIITWAQLGVHSKPAGFLNVNGYYDGLQAFLDHMVKEGFVKVEHRSMVMVEVLIPHLLDRFEHFQSPQVNKRISPEKPLAP